LEISHYIGVVIVVWIGANACCLLPERSILSIHSSQSNLSVSRGPSASDHDDQIVPRRVPFARRKILQDQFESRTGDSAFAREIDHLCAGNTPAIRDSADQIEYWKKSTAKKIAASFFD